MGLVPSSLKNRGSQILVGVSPPLEITPQALPGVHGPNEGCLLEYFISFCICLCAFLCACLCICLRYCVNSSILPAALILPSFPPSSSLPLSPSPLSLSPSPPSHPHPPSLILPHPPSPSPSHPHPTTLIPPPLDPSSCLSLPLPQVHIVQVLTALESR